MERWGVKFLLWTLPKKLGKFLSRPMAKATRDEVQAAVSPELQAIKGQVEQLQRSERERLLLAEETRRRAWQALVLRRLDEILDRVEGGGGASNARRY